jgi:hypothetical protein
VARAIPTSRPRLEREGRALVRYEAASGAGFAGWVAAVVARALQEGTWERLKACPDCRWVLRWARVGLAARSIAATRPAWSATPRRGRRSTAQSGSYTRP